MASKLTVHMPIHGLYTQATPEMRIELMMIGSETTCVSLWMQADFIKSTQVSFFIDKPLNEVIPMFPTAEILLLDGEEVPK